MGGSNEVYRFEDCEVMPARRQILRRGKPVTVEPKVFDLLLYLLEHRDRAVEKNELQDAVWPGVIVTEASLSRCVMKARRAVGDDAAATQIIRTVRGHGYQFMAAVEKNGPEDEEPRQPASAPGNGGHTLTGRPSLIVLPFTNMSDDPQQEFLADGLTQDITTEVSRSGWLFVINRNSAFTYKGKHIDPREVGRELGVRYVVEGTLRRLGEHMRISAELVDAQTGTQVWAERFDRPLAQFFETPDDIVRGIVSALGTELTRAEGQRARRAGEDSLDAWGLIHRGIAISISGFNRASVEEAEAVFRRALELAPDDPRAHVFLGANLATRHIHQWTKDPDRCAREAWQEGRRAMDLAPDDPVILGEWGLINNFLGEAETAVGILERTIQLDPNSAWNFAHLGFALINCGRVEEAMPYLHDAMRLSPRDPGMYWIQAFLAWGYMQLEQYDQAIRELRASIAGYSGWTPAWSALAIALAARGDVEEARRVMQRRLEADTDHSLAAAQRFYRYMARDGEQGERFCRLLESVWPAATR
jgi:TolB-like protein/Flp pilus assembly protein TadD